MKVFKGLSVVALFGAFLSGCSHSELQPEEESLLTQQIKEITAYNGDIGTKTILADDNTSILWMPNDKINVFYGSASAQFTSLNTEPEECTIFSSNTALVYGSTESSSSYIWAVYPYSDKCTHDKTSVSLAVPNSTTSVVAGSFANGTFPAIGRSKDTNIAFYNVCGGICFTVNNENVRSVSITGNNNEDIAGTVKVGFDENERPVVTEVIAGQKTVTVGSSYNNTPFQVGTWYYIPMLPVNFTNGFTMRFYKAYNYSGTESAILVVNSPYEVKRSIFGQVENADNNLTYRVRVNSISFSYPKAFIALGSTLQLTYSFSPSAATYDSIAWTSSDETIATVDQNGVVTPVSSGACSITLTADNVSGSCMVYVSSPSVTTNEASNVSYGSAILNGSISAPEIDVYPRRKAFKYSKTSNTLEGLISSGTTVTASSAGDNFNAAISGLEPNTTYYYVADCYFYTYRSGSNDYGTANHYYGSVQSFTTPAIPTLPDGLVDLGLSVKWASCNVGADLPEEIGNLYAWGEVSPKANYTWSNYIWWTYSFSDGDEYSTWSSYTRVTKYGSSSSNSKYVNEDGDYDSYYWVNDGKTVLDLEDDAARVEWRGTWRMPTQAECQELIDNCTIEKVKYNNCDGYLFTCTKAGNTDKMLFFPMTPAVTTGDEYYYNSGSKSYYGLFWSSSQYLPFPVCAYALRVRYYYNEFSLGPIIRMTGFPVRPVK